QVSPSGWSWSVSATPATRSITFFDGQRMALFGPPSVLRSVGVRPRQIVAWTVALPAWAESPPTQPRALMLVPWLTVPPSESRGWTTYLGPPPCPSAAPLVAVGAACWLQPTAPSTTTVHSHNVFRRMRPPPGPVPLASWTTGSVEPRGGGA